MRKIVLVVFFLSICFTLYSQQLTVAVSPFEVRGGLSKEDAESVTELVTAEIVSNGAVKVVDRNSFNLITAEMKFQDSDWANSNRVAELGKMLNANCVIRGTVMSLAGEIVITTTIIDINTAQRLSQSTLRMTNLRQIFDKLPDFVKDLVKTLPQPNVNHFVGIWESTDGSRKLIMEIRDDGSIFVQRYDNAYYDMDLRYVINQTGSGTGKLTYDSTRVQISLSIKSYGTTHYSYNGIYKFNENNNSFTLLGDGLSSYTGRSSSSDSSYRTFTKVK